MNVAASLKSIDDTYYNELSKKVDKVLDGSTKEHAGVIYDCESLYLAEQVKIKKIISLTKDDIKVMRYRMKVLSNVTKKLNKLKG